jgi:hypothetical protein
VDQSRPDGGGVTAIAIVDPGTVYAADDTLTVLRSTDRGATWKHFPVGPPYYQLENTTNLWTGNGLAWSMTATLGLVATGDSACWLPIDEETGVDPPGVMVLEGGVGDPAMLYAGTFGRGVLARPLPDGPVREPAACIGEPVPRRVRHGLEAGCRMAVRAFGQHRRAFGQRFYEKAIARFQRTAAALAGVDGLSAACVSTLRTMLYAPHPAGGQTTGADGAGS